MNHLPVLTATGLSKRFGKHDVLSAVDLAVPRGCIVGLVGRNGAGKTTLLRCLLGLVRPEAGSSQMFGHPSWDLPDAVKARLGYVPQKPDLPPWLTVHACCDYVGAFYPGWNAQRVAGLVQRWDLDPGHKVGQLSGGQLQALAVVLALGHAPELLVLDEPASALDPIARRTFLQTLVGEVAGGTTVVFSTHLCADLERVADRLMVLSRGRVVIHDELDALRQRIRRLRCAPLPTALQVETWPGVISVERHVDGLVLLIDGVYEAVAERVASETGQAPAIDVLGLEDLVIGLER